MRRATAVAILSLTTMGVAHAELSSTVTVTNDYDLRGISQSAENPALQASVDYKHADDWYAGAWASNVDFGDRTHYELDLYGGFTGKTDLGLGWDAGFIYYSYNKHWHDYPEIYGALTYSWFKGKLSYSNDFGGDSDYPSRHRSAWNLAGEAAIPLPANFTALAHVGYNFGSYWSNSSNPYRQYFDYAVGVGYALQNFNLALKYINTHTSGFAPYVTSDVGNNEGRFVLSISTTFPWQR